MTAARTDETNLAVVGSPWHGRRRRRLAGVLLAAGACLVSFPVATLAASSSSAAAYCSHLPAARVTSILGSKVSFKAAVPVKTTLECEYTGAAFVTLLKELGIPAAKPRHPLESRGHCAQRLSKGNQGQLRRPSGAREDVVQLDCHDRRTSIQRCR